MTTEEILDCIRITPAYAGNTATYGLVARYVKDHPRLRGEHQLLKSALMPKVGSPPPTRGTQAEKGVAHNLSGITPAYAGNTLVGKRGWRSD